MITSELLVEEPELIDLIDKFIAHLPGTQKAIIHAYEEKDFESFLGLIHKMKGVGGGYGYPMLTTLCAEIELTMEEKNFDKVTKQLNEFSLIGEKILAGKDENHKIAKAD